MDASQLTADLARDVVERVAPNELRKFQAHSEAYAKNPSKALKTSRRRRLGLEAIVTPYVLFFAPLVAGFLTEFLKEVGEEVIKKTSVELISAAIKKLFLKGARTDDTAPKPPPLAQDQLQELHRRALAKAQELAVPEAEARRWADALVADYVVRG